MSSYILVTRKSWTHTVIPPIDRLRLNLYNEYVWELLDNYLSFFEERIPPFTAGVNPTIPHSHVLLLIWIFM